MADNKKCIQTCNVFIAMLRAAYFIHQRNHWTSKGSNFYGSHLLFQRLYESVLEDLDGAAEKFMGIFKEGVLDYILQSELTHKISLKYKDLSSFEQSLAIEKDIAKYMNEAIACFKSENTITMGLENLVNQLSDNSEGRAYLLSQSIA